MGGGCRRGKGAARQRSEEGLIKGRRGGGRAEPTAALYLTKRTAELAPSGGKNYTRKEKGNRTAAGRRTKKDLREAPPLLSVPPKDRSKEQKILLFATASPSGGESRGGMRGSGKGGSDQRRKGGELRTREQKRRAKQKTEQQTTKKRQKRQGLEQLLPSKEKRSEDRRNKPLRVGTTLSGLITNHLNKLYHLYKLLYNPKNRIRLLN